MSTLVQYSTVQYSTVLIVKCTLCVHNPTVFLHQLEERRHVLQDLNINQIIITHGRIILNKPFL